MNRSTYSLRFCVALLVATMLATSAMAAAVTATKAKNYGRFVFSFGEPAILKASSAGDKATLEFDKPVTESAEAIRAALPEYVRYAVISQDKKRITLTLYQPYRVRQFVSGKGVGIDLVGAPSKEIDPAPKTKPVVTASKPAATPEPKPTKVKVKEEVKPPSRSQAQIMAETAPSASGEDPMLSTKSEQAKPAAATAEKPEKAPESAILTTKSEEPPKTVEEKPKVTEASKPAESTEQQMLTTKAETPPAPEEKKPEAAASSAAPAEPEKPTEPTASATKPYAPFAVSVTTQNSETTLTFPWTERTAAAVVRRSRDIWIIFSQARDMNAAELSKKMPKHVINVTQYAYEGNSILRLTTDGSLQARSEQVSGNYGWNVILGPKVPDPKLGVSLTADTLEGITRLVLGIYDISTPVRFFDPSAGDLMLFVPSYENGRGITPARGFPEFTLLSGNQGIAIVSKRHDLTLSKTRSGLILSAPGGLSISDILPTSDGTKPLPGASANTGVIMPYEQWHVPHDRFLETLSDRLHDVAKSPRSERAARLFEVAKLYIAEGMMPEASGILDLIKQESPDFYVANRLALIHGAAYVLMDRMEEAEKILAAPELTDVEEAILWRQVVSIHAPEISTADAMLKAAQPQAAPPSNPAPAPDGGDVDASAAAELAPGASAAAASDSVSTGPVFQLLKYNKPFIRFYPPRIRQQLTVIAAEAYIRDKQADKALSVYDILVRDGIIDPVKYDGKFALGAAAIAKKEFDTALVIFDGLSKQKDDLRIASKARYAAAMLRYELEKISADEAAEILENVRLAWRGDRTEKDILDDLVLLYIETKRYDDVLRTYKAMLDGFPSDPRTLAISAEMSQLFQRIFLEGLGDEMEPIKALSLFYEFRDLTPLGDNGDTIIQRLADRLAAVDLLSRATQLLEHQIKFRLTGEPRSRVGARLALLHLLNKQPAEALNVLEVTNFGANKPELQTQRQQLMGEALNQLGKYEEALNAIYHDRTSIGAQLRLEILWAMQDWPNVANRAEDILSSRPNLTDPLTPKETEVLLKLALAYTFEGDYVQLRYLRDYYTALIPDSGYKNIFDFITNDTTPLDPDDFNMVAQQINRTEGFLDTFKAKIAEGKLSEAVK